MCKTAFSASKTAVFASKNAVLRIENRGFHLEKCRFLLENWTKNVKVKIFYHIYHHIYHYLTTCILIIYPRSGRCGRRFWKLQYRKNQNLHGLCRVAREEDASQPNEQREQKPNLFGLCQVVKEEDVSQPNEQWVNVSVSGILYPKHNSRGNIELAADFPACL